MRHSSCHSYQTKSTFNSEIKIKFFFRNIVYCFRLDKIILKKGCPPRNSFNSYSNNNINKQYLYINIIPSNCYVKKKRKREGERECLQSYT
jgi:hypothetical protein